jgi:hypothetical protein
VSAEPIEPLEPVIELYDGGRTSLGTFVSEATGADLEHLGTERGHRTLVVISKGGKVITIPLAPRTAGPSTWRSASASRDRYSSAVTGGDWSGIPPPASSAGSPAAPGSPRGSSHTR